MVAYLLTTPLRGSALMAPAAVGSSDTITRDKLGTRGVLLEIVNGNASPNNVTISDASVTPSLGGAAPIAQAVANATSRVFKILPVQADPITGTVTVTNSVTATVNYNMYPLD